MARIIKNISLKALRNLQLTGNIDNFNFCLDTTLANSVSGGLGLGLGERAAVGTNTQTAWSSLVVVKGVWWRRQPGARAAQWRVIGEGQRGGA